MESNDNKTRVRRFIEEIENTGDVTNIREFISDDYVEVHNGEIYQIGIKGAIDHVLGVRNVFPDLRMTIDDQVSEGEWVLTSYLVTGTFSGEELSGYPIIFHYVNVGPDVTDEEAITDVYMPLK